LFIQTQNSGISDQKSLNKILPENSVNSDDEFRPQSPPTLGSEVDAQNQVFPTPTFRPNVTGIPTLCGGKPVSFGGFFKSEKPTHPKP
jgi:hypothetical protein